MTACRADRVRCRLQHLVSRAGEDPPLIAAREVPDDREFPARHLQSG